MTREQIAELQKLKPPKPTKDDRCVECGAQPVAFAVYRTGGVFTPPPMGVWTFVCVACHEQKAIAKAEAP